MGRDSVFVPGVSLWHAYSKYAGIIVGRETRFQSGGFLHSESGKFLNSTVRNPSFAFSTYPLSSTSASDVSQLGQRIRSHGKLTVVTAADSSSDVALENRKFAKFVIPFR